MPSIELVDRHDQQSRGRYFRGGAAVADTPSSHGLPSSSSDGRANGRANGSSSSPGRSGGPTIAKIPGLSKVTGGRRTIGGSDHKEDLIFSVEDGYGNIVDDPSEDYAGLERELEDRLRLRTWRRLLAAAALVLAFAAGVAAHVSRAGKVAPSTVHGGGSGAHGSGHGGGGEGKRKPSAPAPTPPAPAPTPATVDETVVDVDEGMDDIDSLASLWPTAAPAPPFEICAPPLTPDRKADKHSHSPVFHIGTLTVVPEAPAEDDEDDTWEYTFSAMDISDDASVVAVGLSDFSAGSDWDVGMVRAFAWSCKDKAWRQLGQDLRGSREYEQFGHRISSSEDGKVMAVSAPQETYEDGNGFVAVYYLDEDANRWEKLGGRVDDLTSATDIGHALDLSDRGDTLAVLGLADSGSSTGYSYTVRVFRYDPDAASWKRKGRDLSVSVNYADGDYEFAPQLSLSDDGDELSVSDPEFGVVRYHFHFAKNRWEKQDSKTVKFDDDDYWIDSVDVDDSGNVVAFTAFEVRDGDGEPDYEAVKVVDFSNGTADEVYSASYTDYAVGANAAVSDSGRVAAVVASKYDVDDDEFWSDEETVGALTVLTREGGKWGVLGEGTEAEGMGVPGSFVTLAGDGRIAAVGSADVVALYGIVLSDGGEDTADGKDGNEDDGAAEEEEEKDGGEEKNGATEEQILDGDSAAAATNGPFELCPPFPDAASASHAGDLDSLPKQSDQHTLSVATNVDGSVVAVGIDSYDGEDRGLARVFGWSCADGKYLQMGQDLLGTEEFDGFGQSVDLSADGKTLAVGANQPPPGKSGYVEIYTYNAEGMWEIVGHRLDGFKSRVGDVGREVRVSSDGLTVAFLGSIVTSSQYDYDSSFVRVVQLNKKGKWVLKGSDLVGSVDYDEYGSEAHIALSGDGGTLTVAGSYDEFLLKVYAFDSATGKKNWTEHVVKPPKGENEDGGEDEYFDDDDDEYGTIDCWDLNYDYFTGRDVAVNADGTVVAVAGTRYTVSDEDALVRVLRKDPASGNWTLSPDPVDFAEDYTLSSADVSDDGATLAVGINVHADGGFDDRGALFVASLLTKEELENEEDMAATGTLGWTGLGEVDGRGEDDLLGSRATVSGDGTLAAASSRRGYVSFFKAG